MRFADFLRTTVLISMAAASVLAAVTLAGAASTSDQLLVPVAAAWWVLAGLIGLWLGRRAETSSPIASLLAGARMQASLPEVDPARTVLNRLWPLLRLHDRSRRAGGLPAPGARDRDRLCDHLGAWPGGASPRPWPRSRSVTGPASTSSAPRHCTRSGWCARRAFAPTGSSSTGPPGPHPPSPGASEPVCARRVAGRDRRLDRRHRGLAGGRPWAGRCAGGGRSERRPRPRRTRARGADVHAHRPR